MKIFLIIGFVIVVLLGYLDLRLIFVKYDIEDYIENRPKGKSPNATKKLKKLKLIIKFIWLVSMIWLGVISYLWGRYIIVG